MPFPLHLPAFICRIGLDALPDAIEDLRTFRFKRIARSAFEPRAGADVGILPPAFINGIAPRTRESHLQVFARHVRAGKVVRCKVSKKHAVKCRTARPRILRRTKTPVREQFGFIRLADKNALLALADAIKIGLEAIIDIRLPSLRGAVERRFHGISTHTGMCAFPADRRVGNFLDWIDNSHTIP